MKLTFRQILSRPAQDGRCRVVLDVAWDNRRQKLPTGVSRLAAHFNAAARRPVSTKAPQSAKLAAKLAKVEKAAPAAEAQDTAFAPPPEPSALPLHPVLHWPGRSAGNQPKISSVFLLA